MDNSSQTTQAPVVAGKSAGYGKGHLALSKVTPVIKAIFGPYNLKASPDGTASFERRAGQFDPTAEVILDALCSVAIASGATQGKDYGSRVAKLRMLVQHLGAKVDCEGFANFVVRKLPEPSRPSLGILILLALALDDGHGLASASFMLDDDGQEIYEASLLYICGTFSVGVSLPGALVELKKMERGIVSGDLSGAGKALAGAVLPYFEGIRDPETKKAVAREAVAEIMRKLG